MYHLLTVFALLPPTVFAQIAPDVSQVSDTAAPDTTSDGRSTLLTLSVDAQKSSALVNEGYKPVVASYFVGFDSDSAVQSAYSELYGFYSTETDFDVLTAPIYAVSNYDPVAALQFQAAHATDLPDANAGELLGSIYNQALALQTALDSVSAATGTQTDTASPAATDADGNSSDNGSSGNDDGDGDGGGLSTGAKIGIGVGVPLGVILIVTIGMYIFFMNRRKRAARQLVAENRIPAMADGTQPPELEKFAGALAPTRDAREANLNPIHIHEADSRAVGELDSGGPAHELEDNTKMSATSGPLRDGVYELDDQR